VTVYIAGDVRAIQDYVFGSPRLLEMRGASAILDAFDRSIVPRRVEAAGGEVAFAGGGNFLARWADGDDERAEAFADEIRSVFFDLTGTDGLTVIRVADDRPFEQAHARVAHELVLAKRESPEARQLASMPFLKRCESCGREAADIASRLGSDPDRPQWVGPICHRKRRMHGSLRRVRQATSGFELRLTAARERYRVAPLIPRLQRQATPRDFRELVGDDDLAVVVADGNGLGEWFDSLTWQQYGELSKRVTDTLAASLEGALEAVFPGDTPLDVQVLIAGGDDLVAALPAHHALRFAREVVDRFRVTRSEGVDKDRGMAAGVLLAGPSFPFRAAHALAAELMHRAKARCRDDGLISALDFHRVKGTHVQSLSAELQAVERRAGGHAWSYGASGPFHPAELDDLLDLAGRLRTTVSASQRGVLREILSPRDDGPHTPVDDTWGVPIRVVKELALWHGRQVEKPFDLQPEKLVVRTRTRAGDPIVRLRLADALLLAELPAPAEAADLVEAAR
jgi:hypothetical protein